MNPILMTDSYKVTHWKRYPPKTSEVFSYFESRNKLPDETVFFGLQYILETNLLTRISRSDIQEAKEITDAHFGRDVFNSAGWTHILEDHYGKLPVEISAVPEGTVVPVSNVLMTIRNTCPQCYWLPNYLETLLVQAWYPTTVATLSRNIKKTMNQFYEDTGCDKASLAFRLHDFGFRGVSSVESAGIGGAAHLVNFSGTDTMAALLIAKKYYSEPMAGFSIPAAEHSTITSWGRENEAEAFRNMLHQWPNGFVAVVSDSYDIYAACRDLWGKQLRSEVLERNGTLVVRPDSGIPNQVVPEVLRLLGDAFGTVTNSRGYKNLDPHIRVIQGDGVNSRSIFEILTIMKSLGWAADNIAFGMGGALLQSLNRDTFNFAFKCSSITVDGVEKDVYKQPVGSTMKVSKPGKLALVLRDGKFQTINKKLLLLREVNLIRPVFKDGSLLSRQTFSDIRKRAEV